VATLAFGVVFRHSSAEAGEDTRGMWEAGTGLTEPLHRQLWWLMGNGNPFERPVTRGA
jgi:hypothetical protein